MKDMQIKFHVFPDLLTNEDGAVAVMPVRVGGPPATHEIDAVFVTFSGFFLWPLDDHYNGSFGNYSLYSNVSVFGVWLFLGEKLGKCHTFMVSRKV
jgi:hypothetical protein